MDHSNALVRLPDQRPVQRVVTDIQVRAHPLELPVAGISPMPTEARAYPGVSSDWLVGPAKTDPLYRRRDAVPADARRRVKEAQRLVGFGLDDLLIAHEVPKFLPATVTDYQTVSPKQIAELVELPETMMAKTRKGTRELIDGLYDAFIPAVGALATGIGMLAGGLADLALDPAVFGLVQVPELDTAVWFLLAQWG